MGGLDETMDGLHHGFEVIPQEAMVPQLSLMSYGDFSSPGNWCSQDSGRQDEGPPSDLLSVLFWGDGDGEEEDDMDEDENFDDMDDDFDDDFDDDDDEDDDFDDDDDYEDEDDSYDYEEDVDYDEFDE